MSFPGIWEMPREPLLILIVTERFMETTRPPLVRSTFAMLILWAQSGFQHRGQTSIVCSFDLV